MFFYKLIGGGLNGFNEHIPRELATMYWFNRIVNLIRLYAPQAKLIFVDLPETLVDGIERVLNNSQ